MAISDLSTIPSEAYRKGFMDGCRMDFAQGVLGILGYDLAKLIEIISDWEQRQPVTLFKTKDDRVKVESVDGNLVVWADGVKIQTSKLPGGD